jgi:hypothetical protein
MQEHTQVGAKELKCAPTKQIKKPQILYTQLY